MGTTEDVIIFHSATGEEVSLNLLGVRTHLPELLRFATHADFAIYRRVYECSSTISAPTLRTLGSFFLPPSPRLPLQTPPIVMATLFASRKAVIVTPFKACVNAILADIGPADRAIAELEGDPRFRRIVVIIADFFVAIANSNTLIRIWRLASRLKIPSSAELEDRLLYELAALADRKEVDFFRLKREEMEQLLCSDRLHVGDEEEVVKLIELWIEGLPEERQADGPALYAHLRINYLNSAIQDEERATAISSFGNQFLGPRETRDFLFTLGGFFRVGTVQNWHCNVSSYRLDKSSSSWILEPRLSLPDEISEFGAVVVNGIFYVFGGLSQMKSPTSRSWKFDGSRWSRIPDMLSKRSNFARSVVVLGERIYVIGGRGEGPAEHFLASAEYFDIHEQQWHALPDMQRGRYDTAAAVVNGVIYVGGGIGSGDELLSCMMIFSPEIHIWTLAGELPEAKAGHVLVESPFTPGALLLVGGSSNRLTSSPDVWHRPARRHSADSWKLISKMLAPRIRQSVVCVPGRQLIAFSGCLDTDPFAESFDGNSWSVLMRHPPVAGLSGSSSVQLLDWKKL